MDTLTSMTCGRLNELVEEYGVEGVLKMCEEELNSELK
jgi:hypothetical protein